MNMNYKRCAVLAMTLGLVLFVALPSRADDVLTNQLMAEAQIENLTFVSLLFGADAGSPLNFTNNVDVAGMKFSYSLNPGATYQGMAMTLTGSGAFDSASDSWLLSSAGSLGSTSWTASGAETATPTGSGSWTIASEEHLTPPNPWDIEFDGTANDDGTSSGLCQDTLFNAAWGGPYECQGEGDGENWKKTSDGPPPPRDNQIQLNGITPYPDGGMGTSTGVISAIPEPSTFSLISLGIAGLISWGVRNRSAGRNLS